MTTAGQGPGWYPAPNGSPTMWWWDGARWTEPAPGYAPAPGSTRGMVAAHVLGWWVLASALVIVIGSFMTWATALGGALSKAGTDDGSDGWITFVLGLFLAGTGVLVAVRQGRRWLVWTSLLFPAIVVITALADMGDIASRDGVSVGPGLFVVLVGGLAAAGLVIAAAVRREPAT